MSNSPIEPSADMRTFALHMRQMYMALTLEGFTQQEALFIIAQFLAANRPQS